MHRRLPANRNGGSVVKIRVGVEITSKYRQQNVKSNTPDRRYAVRTLHSTRARNTIHGIRPKHFVDVFRARMTIVAFYAAC